MPSVTPEEWCSQSLGSSSVIPTGRPSLKPIALSALCSKGWRRLTLTGMIRDALTRKFYDPRNIEESGRDGLDGLVWREGERTGILIESIYRWTGDLIEKRSAVIIKPNAMTNLRLGIADSLGPNEHGQMEYQTFWVGSHTVFCLHGSGAGAEVLAAEVSRELQEWHPVFVNYLKMFRWQVTEIGGVSIVEEARQMFVIPITIGWAYDEHWRLEYESLKLRKISIHTLLDGAFVG